MRNDILSQMAERDLASFLPLCGEADKKFFDPSCKGREAEEYVRLTLIATALGRRGVVVYLLGEAEYESKDDEVMRCLASVKNDYRTVVNWIEDFIGEIREPQDRQAAEELWNAKKKGLSETEFDIARIKRRRAGGKAERAFASKANKILKPAAI